MKKLYFLLLLLSALQFSFAATKTLVQSTANIADPAAWSGGQLPQPGDSVIIPNGKVLTLSFSISFPFSTKLLVYGEIRFTGSPISVSLDAASTITIYSGGKLSGTVGTQTISLNGLQIYNGTQTVNGGMWAAQSTNGFVPFSPLPIKFESFTLSRTSNNVLVQWSVSQEVNVSMYEVERSVDGTSWSTIAYVAPVTTTSSVKNYSFTDKSLSAKTIYYRIKEVDFDAKTSYSSIQSIHTEVTTAASNIKIASLQNKVLLQFPTLVKGQVVIRFVSLSGQVLDQQTINNPLGQVMLNSKLTGNYIISVSNGQDINTAKQVIL